MNITYARLRATLDAHGWIMLCDSGDLKTLTETASLLGDIVPSFPRNPLIDDLFYPVRTPHPKWLSYQFPATQPWHTDCPFYPVPPRYCLLQCVRANNLVYTDLASPFPLLAPEMVRRLGSEAWRIYNGYQSTLISIFDEKAGRHKFRYQPNTMRPLFNASQGTVQQLQAICDNAIICSPVLIENSLLVFDNWSLLHRRRVVDKSPQLTYDQSFYRHIRRALVVESISTTS